MQSQLKSRHCSGETSSVSTIFSIIQAAIDEQLIRQEFQQEQILTIMESKREEDKMQLQVGQFKEQEDVDKEIRQLGANNSEFTASPQKRQRFAVSKSERAVLYPHNRQISKSKATPQSSPLVYDTKYPETSYKHPKWAHARKYGGMRPYKRIPNDTFTQVDGIIANLGPCSLSESSSQAQGGNGFDDFNVQTKGRKRQKAYSVKPPKKSEVGIDGSRLSNWYWVPGENDELIFGNIHEQRNQNESELECGYFSQQYSLVNSMLKNSHGKENQEEHQLRSTRCAFINIPQQQGLQRKQSQEFHYYQNNKNENVSHQNAVQLKCFERAELDFYSQEIAKARRRSQGDSQNEFVRYFSEIRNPKQRDLLSVTDHQNYCRHYVIDSIDLEGNQEVQKRQQSIQKLNLIDEETEFLSLSDPSGDFSISTQDTKPVYWADQTLQEFKREQQQMNVD